MIFNFNRRTDIDKDDLDFLSIYTTIGDACVCVCVFAKFDQFLPVRSHFDTKRPVHFFHVATFQSATFGRPLFAFVLCVLRQKIIKRTENARKAYRSA